MTITINEQLLEEKLVAIEKVRSWSPRVISKLENTIRTGDDETLFRVSPLKWAAEKNVDEHEAIDLFLHSAKTGLFYMAWNVICPCCARITQSLRELHSVEARSTCKLCFRKDQVNLDDSVQISFTLSPSIRSLRFHHPETLSLEDYCFKYLFEPSAILNGMMPLIDAFEFVRRHFSEFLPGEKFRLETEVGVGILSCFDLFGQQSIGLFAKGEPTAEVQQLTVKLMDSGFEVPLPEMQPGEFSVGPLNYAGTFYLIRPGKVILEFEQAASAKTALLVGFFPLPLNGIEAGMPAELPPEFAGFVDSLKDDSAHFDRLFYHLYSSPHLTAKRLFTCQTFHDLFHSEVFQESQGFSVKDVTVMFTDLKSSTQLYNQIGDLNAFALVREHYGVLNKAIIDNHGAVVKTIGDAIMATFAEPGDAVCAGLEMLQGLREMNSGSQHGGLALKIGIHRGAAISVTLNERIDYFGQTINTASRVQGVAGGNEIYITDDIYSAAGVADLVAAHHCDTETMKLELKGIDEPVKVYKLTGGH
jgi:class 3 adenylate cyclase